MRYLVQVFDGSRTFCKAARKADAQEAFERFCRERPNAHVVFTESKRGVIAERPATTTKPIQLTTLREKETIMELDELMRFARNYRKLGWAIQEQVDDILNDDFSDINPNALVEIDQYLRGFNEDLDAAIDQAKESAIATRT